MKKAWLNKFELNVVVRLPSDRKLTEDELLLVRGVFVDAINEIDVGALRKAFRPDSPGNEFDMPEIIVGGYHHEDAVSVRVGSDRLIRR